MQSNFLVRSCNFCNPQHSLFPLFETCREPCSLSRLAVVTGANLLIGSNWNDSGRQNNAWRPNRASSRFLFVVSLWKRQGFSVDKVIHHDDVIFAVIVRTWGDVAGRDPHASDPGVVKFDAEERLISIARRGGDKTAEQQLAVDTEKLHQRAGVAVSALFAGTAAIRLIDVSENCAKATNCCWSIST